MSITAGSSAASAAASCHIGARTQASVPQSRFTQAGVGLLTVPSWVRFRTEYLHEAPDAPKRARLAIFDGDLGHAAADCIKVFQLDDRLQVLCNEDERAAALHHRLKVEVGRLLGRLAMLVDCKHVCACGASERLRLGNQQLA